MSTRYCIVPGCESRPYGSRARRCMFHQVAHERERNRKQKREWRQRKIAMGLCTICGTKAASPGLKTCEPCRTARGPDSKHAPAKRRTAQHRRDVGRLIVQKVHGELGEMLKEKTEVWDPERVRSLGHALALFYVWQHEGQRFTTLKQAVAPRSYAKKFLREIEDEL